MPQTLVISNPPADVDRPFAEDEMLHQELVQLELDQVVSDEVDEASRR